MWGQVWRSFIVNRSAQVQSCWLKQILSHDQAVHLFLQRKTDSAQLLIRAPSRSPTVQPSALVRQNCQKHVQHGPNMGQNELSPTWCWPRLNMHPQYGFTWPNWSTHRSHKVQCMVSHQPSPQHELKPEGCWCQCPAGRKPWKSITAHRLFFST